MYKLLDSEQFHSMQATVETVKFDDGMTVKRLVSYDSVVCDIDMLHGDIYLYPRHQYSPTTMRQLTSFLNEYMPLEHECWNLARMRKLYNKVVGNLYPTMGPYSVCFFKYVLGTTRSW